MLRCVLVVCATTSMMTYPMMSEETPMTTEPPTEVACSGPHRSDVTGELPAVDVPVTVGGVELPPGQVSIRGRMWHTTERVDNPAVVWAALVDAYPETGLWPLTSGPTRTPNLPPSDDLTLIDAVHVDALMEQTWRHVALWEDQSGNRDESLFTAEELADQLAWLGDDTEFTGLMPTQTARDNAVASQRNARVSSRYIYLVAAQRPADVPAQLGWLDNYNLETPEELSAILRSWEDRAGAVLTWVGDNGLGVRFERPPTNPDDIRRWTMEQYAFGAETAAANFEAFQHDLADRPFTFDYAWQ